MNIIKYKKKFIVKLIKIFSIIKKIKIYCQRIKKYKTLKMTN